MTPWLDDGDVRLYHGDARDVLRSLPAGIAQTCATSPPYWGLRDYGTGAWDGGDADCDHLGKPHSTQAGFNERYFGRESGTDKQGELREPFRDVCGKCGARRVDSQLGLEATPDAYVAALVAVFREVRRVLRDDGTVWCNLGDTYNSRLDASHGGWNGSSPNPQTVDQRGPTNSWSGQIKGLAAKNLVGIPWRVAFALQADGWVLRSDIIWAKPNPMPESVSDRPTKAHEYVFLLAKQPKYFFDADAIREEGKDWSTGGPGTGIQETQHYGAGNGGNSGLGALAQRYKDGAIAPGRNCRSVWEIATQPTPEAHFATFPEALVRRCILAGSREGDTVLDPFVGSGTTALVARKHGRRAIGVDLSEPYLEIASRRLGQQSLFAQTMESS